MPKHPGPPSLPGGQGALGVHPFSSSVDLSLQDMGRVWTSGPLIRGALAGLLPVKTASGQWGKAPDVSGTENRVATTWKQEAEGRGLAGEWVWETMGDPESGVRWARGDVGSRGVYVRA